MASTKVGVIITADASDLNSKLSKTMKEMGAFYDEYHRLTNASGQYIGSLSQADVALGHYVDALGRTRNAQGQLVDGLTRTQKALRMYIDETGNVRSAEGLIIQVSQERVAALGAEERAILEAQQASAAAAVAQQTKEAESYRTSIALIEEKIKVIEELAATEQRGYNSDELSSLAALKKEVAELQKLKEANKQATEEIIKRKNAEVEATLANAPGGQGGAASGGVVDPNVAETAIQKLTDIQSIIQAILAMGDEGKEKVDLVTRALDLMGSSASVGAAAFQKIQGIAKEYAKLKAAIDAATKAEMIRQLVSQGVAAVVVAGIVAAIAAYAKLSSWMTDYRLSVYQIVDANDKLAIALERVKKAGRNDGAVGEMRKLYEEVLQAITPFLGKKFEQTRRARNEQSLGAQMEAATLSGSVTKSEQMAQARQNMANQQKRNEMLRSEQNEALRQSSFAPIRLIAAYQNQQKLNQGEEDLKRFQEEYAKQWGDLVAQNLPQSEADKYNDTLKIYDEQIAKMRRDYAANPTRTGKEAIDAAEKSRSNFAQNALTKIDKTPIEKYNETMAAITKANVNGLLSADELAKNEKAAADELQKNLGFADIKTPSEKLAETLKNLEVVAAASQWTPEQKEAQKQKTENDFLSDIGLSVSEPPEEAHARQVAALNEALAASSIRQDAYNRGIQAANDELKKNLGFADIKTPSEKLAETLKNLEVVAAASQWTPEQKEAQKQKAENDFLSDIGLSVSEPPQEAHARQVAALNEALAASTIRQDAYNRGIQAANDELKKNLGFADIKTPSEKLAETLKNIEENAEKWGWDDDQKKKQKDLAVSQYRNESGLDKYLPKVPDTTEVQENLKSWAAHAKECGYSQRDLARASRKYKEDIEKQNLDKYGISDLAEQIKTPQEKYLERLQDVQDALAAGAIDKTEALKMEEKLRQNLNKESTKGEKLSKSMQYGSQEMYTAQIKQPNNYQNRVTTGITSVVKELQASGNNRDTQMKQILEYLEGWKKF